MINYRTNIKQIRSGLIHGTKMANLKHATKLLLCVFMVYSQCSYSDCPKDVQVIKQGQAANCDGFLFSDEAERDAEDYKNSADYFKELSDALKEKSRLQADENKILEQRLKLYVDTTQTLSQDLAKRDTNETLYRFVYFSLGVLVTGVIAVNVKK